MWKRLLTELRDYQALGEQEDNYRSRMIELAELSPNPGERSQFEPGHFTASSYVLSPDSSALLLIFHGKLRRWLQPGGHFETADNSASDAAKRELSEETGVDASLLQSAPFDLDIHSIPARKMEPEHEHFDLRFVFRANSDKIAAASDALDARWVKLAEISQIESDAWVMRAAAKLQERLR